MEIERHFHVPPSQYRHELKYFCTEAELKIIESRLRTVMEPDKHAGPSGEYTIRSVYFDDCYGSCFASNDSGTDPREKFRIRAYNCTDKVISLEKKIKNRGMTGKQSCRIDRETCMKMIAGEPITEQLGRDPLLDEWILMCGQRLLRPVMLGEYVRQPFVYRLGNVRVTFDRHISASRTYGGIFTPDIGRVSVLPTGRSVLEVKWDDYLPDVIYRMIDMGHLQQTTFSKFYLGCKALGGRVNEL